MCKYILDSIRNNSRLLLRDLSLPQKKAVTEIIRGLFTANTPVLRHIAQNPRVSTKKQGNKYSHHLGNIHLKEKVEQSALNKVRHQIRKNSIIAYDLTDISKPSAKKMPGLSTVFDGSRRTTSTGYTLHGLGVNGILLKLEVHNQNSKTLNQTRKQIVQEYLKHFSNKGIWVFDRGNDHKHFFKFLRQEAKVQFIARLKSNRGVVIKENGVYTTVDKLSEGRYQVFLMNKNNNKVDTSTEYTLIIKKHLGGEKPAIRLLAGLDHSFSDSEVINMYLERWGIENIFKRGKQKFNLEKIRLQNTQKLVNLIALIQFAINVSTVTFLKIQKSTLLLISGVLMLYKKFLKQKSLTFNVDSFISFIKQHLKPISRHSKAPHLQLSLISRRQLEKLGSF